MNRLGGGKKASCRVRIGAKCLGLAFVALTLFGCGGEPTLSGTVTLDGEPLTKGEITFVGDGLPTAYGTIGTDGSYAAKSGAQKTLKAGNYRVAIGAYEQVPSGSQFAPPSKKLITPRKYSNAAESGLTVEVEPGSNQQDFALVTE